MRLPLVLGCAALLAACTQAPIRPVVSPDAVIRFDLEGRLSVRQGDVVHHVSITWRHNAEQDEILLSGPLGQGLAELRRDAAGARLLTSDRRSIVATDWESLAERAFGVRLPLSNMPRWVVGGAPAAGADGWQIDYLDVEAGRPVLMEMRRGDIEVRLKVDAWNKP